jgi:hypothetical protein
MKLLVVLPLCYGELEDATCINPSLSYFFCYDNFTFLLDINSNYSELSAEFTVIILLFSLHDMRGKSSTHYITISIVCIWCRDIQSQYISMHLNV